MNTLDELLKMIPEGLAGTIMPGNLISFLQKLPKGQPIGASVSHQGQEWMLSLNLRDLKS
jgi:hypothetical protein